MSPRPRPQLHFTVRSGFTNDPHGIVRVADRYYMFFQYNPDGHVQSPHVSWGQASSSDLVLWQEEPVALTPTEDEVGCWSGSTVLAADGPVIAYTSVRPNDWDAGRVVLARPLDAMHTWQRDPQPPALAGPPDEFETVAFRDPHIRPAADGSGWRAVMGAGLPDVGGCAIEYAMSSDLRTWTLQGVLATRAADISAPLATGTVWECPQFLTIDGNWLLIVSVWEDGVGQYVAYAIGDYDGTRFVPATWGRFAQDDLQYATTTFTDAEGRPCAMSWLRESPDFPPDDPSPWRSAMSLPIELTVRRGMLVASFHRNLDRHFEDHQLVCSQQGVQEHRLQGEPWRLSIESTGALSASVESPDGTEIWKLHVDADSRMVTVNPGRESGPISWSLLSDGNFRLDVIGDAGIIEIASEQAGGIAAFRVPGWDGTGRLTVKTEDQGKVTFGRWREP